MFKLSWKENKENLEYPFLITLEKGENYFVIGTPDILLFKGLLESLKKFCVLEGFYQEYDIIEKLGSGHFASVYLVKHKETGKKFAAKVIKKNSSEFQKTMVIFFNFLINIIIYF